MRTPETLSLAERAARLQADARAQDVEPARPASLDDRRTSLALAMAPIPPPQPTFDGHTVELIPITDIDCYEGNPRVSENPRYDQLRESIKVEGITGLLSVTRRPGEQRYITHGGGNTRLRIAKELYACGYSQFSHLNVVVKPWSGELNVIAAHLSENENRGETSFWEKALGVTRFTKLHSQSSGKQTLTASQINDHLKQFGMHFGVRNIQNFLFATQYLSPIGPWLKSRSVNMQIRPQLNQLLELARHLDKKSEVLFALKEELERQAEDLQMTARSHRDGSDDDASVDIDVTAMLRGIAAAVARTLDLEVHHLLRMSDALAQAPKMHPRELLAMGHATEQAPATHPLDGARTAGAADLPPPATANQPMGAADTAVGPAEPSGSRAQLLCELASLLAAIDQVVPVSDFVVHVDTLPFGFMVDIPCDIDPPVRGELADQRKMVWQLLACISGQLHERYWRVAVPHLQGTRWAAEQVAGLMSFANQLTDGLGVGSGPVNDEHTVFDMYVSSYALWSVFSHGQIAPLLLRLLTIRELIQQATPGSDRQGLCLTFGDRSIEPDPRGAP